MATMPNDKRYAAGDVWPLAGELLAYLRPACRRIAVAGSLRRKAETVKDIEIVAEPLLDVQPPAQDCGAADGAAAA